MVIKKQSGRIIWLKVSREKSPVLAGNTILLGLRSNLNVTGRISASWERALLAI